MENDRSLKQFDPKFVAKISPIAGESEVAPPTAGIQTPSRVSGVENLKQGYTKLPNSILMLIVSGCLTKAETQLVLLIARLTISFNQKVTYLSKTTICNYLGVQGKTTLEAIRTLEAKGLILKFQGSETRRNGYSLNFESTLFQKKPDVATNVIPISGSNTRPLDQDQKGTHHLRQQDQKSTSQGDQKCTHYKQVFINKKSSLSKNEDPVIREYFQNLKTQHKRAAELKHYLELRKSHSEQDLSIALEAVQKKGTPSGGREVYAPFAFLAHSIDQVLKGHQQGMEKAKRTEIFNKQRDQLASQHLAIQEAENQEFQKQKESFYETLSPEDQQFYFLAAKQKYKPLAGIPEFIESSAIQIWSQQSRENTCI